MDKAPTPLASLQEVPGKYRIMVGIEEITAATLPAQRYRAQNLRAVAVDWDATPKEMIERDLKNAGRNSYVMSPIDSSNKESRGYTHCSGVVAMGLGKDGQNISLLTHQAPYYVEVEKYKDQFETDLVSRLEELVQRCVPGTIDVVLVGGMVEVNKTLLGNEKPNQKHLESYHAVMSIMADKVRKHLHVEPRIFGENKLGGGYGGGITEVVLDTEHRRLHMYRAQHQTTGDFDRPASEVLKDRK